MNRLIILSIFAAFVLSGCEDSPYADFQASATIVEVGEPVYFTNYSDDFEFVEWDFDDGTYSNDFDPIHSFPVPGIYRVRLSAFGYDDRVSTASIDIEVLTSTSLHITVREYYDEYVISDAEVTLYTSLNDWEAISNPFLYGETDRRGEIIFEGLSYTGRYYIDVWAGNYHNYWLAEDDLAFIETLPLEPNAVNYFTAWVDYDPDQKSGTAKNLKSTKPRYKVLKIEPRKYSDKPAPGKVD